MSRQDIFTLIHKGIRSMIYELGKKILQTDFTDRNSSKYIIEILQHDMEMLVEHGKDEEEFIFPELRQYEPALIDLFLNEHHILNERIRKIKSLIEKLEFIKEDELRIDMGENLNRAFNDFSASYLTHMHHEETTLLPTTWEHFSDEQLGMMRTNVQRNTSPERYAEWLHWTFGATNDAELVTLFKGLKNSAPESVFKNILNIAETTLGMVRFSKIRDAAGL